MDEAAIVRGGTGTRTCARQCAHVAFLAVVVSAFASLSSGCGGSQGVEVVAFPGPLEVCYRQDYGSDPVVRYPELTHHGTGSFGLWTAMSSKSSRTSGAVSDDVRAYEFEGEWIRRLTIISADAPYAADGGELPIVVLDFERLRGTDFDVRVVEAASGPVPDWAWRVRLSDDGCSVSRIRWTGGGVDGAGR